MKPVHFGSTIVVDQSIYIVGFVFDEGEHTVQRVDLKEDDSLVSSEFIKAVGGEFGYPALLQVEQDSCPWDYEHPNHYPDYEHPNHYPDFDRPNHYPDFERPNHYPDYGHPNHYPDF